jgi:hypothetical protein
MEGSGHAVFILYNPRLCLSGLMNSRDVQLFTFETDHEI